MKLAILVRRLTRHVLDVHAAFGRNNESDAASRTIDQEGKIKFPDDSGAYLEINPVDLLAGRAGLHRYEGPPKHFADSGLYLGHRFGEPYPASPSRLLLLKLAFSAPARVDLRFHDPNRASQFLRRGHGVGGAQHRDPARNRDAEFLEDGLGLVLVDIHLRSLVRWPPWRLTADQAVFTPVQWGKRAPSPLARSIPRSRLSNPHELLLIGSAACKAKICDFRL